MKNYGLDLEREKFEQSETDWIFGAASAPCLVQIPYGERKKYLPRGEVQYGREDMKDCATRAPINILETKFNWLFEKLSKENKQWLIDKGYKTENGIEFSDAMIAISSQTTKQGNSLIGPLKAIHEFGLIPKSKLPLLPEMTWDEYHNPARITEEMKNLGLEFLKRFTLNYERVYEIEYRNLIRQDILDVGGYAWTQPAEGVYPRVDYAPNHAFIVFDGEYEAFDNYTDFDGDFYKNLAPDYNFIDYGYRIYISSVQTVQEEEPVRPKFSNNWVLDLIKSFMYLWKYEI